MRKHKPFVSKVTKGMTDPASMLFHIMDTLDHCIEVALEQKNVNDMLSITDKMLDTNDRYMSICLMEEEEENEPPKPKLGFDTARPIISNSSNGQQDLDAGTV